MGSSGTDLKILVDVKSNKVAFAEAGKDLVDFVFTIMSLPLSTVTKLLNDEKIGMVGSLGSLYKSIESLGVEFYEPNLNKDSVFKPRLPAVAPLLSLYGHQTELKFYSCDKHAYTVRDYSGSCWNCRERPPLTQHTYTFSSDSSKNPGYVKRGAPYILMDNLEVKPMSVSLIRSLFNDFDRLEEQHVQFGRQKGLALLKASLEKQDVLTTVFLGNKKC